MPSAPKFFDRIADAYDATRDPPAPDVMDRFAEELRSTGGARFLEVGVGTGRIAAPLSERGIWIAGVDAAWGMLRRARAKGLRRIAHGDAYRLPVRDAALDGVLFVHVLQLLDRPDDALREAARASRLGVFAMMSPTFATDERPPPEDDALRLLVAELGRRGHAHSAARRPGEKEAALLDRWPASRVTTLLDRLKEEPLADPLTSVARGASRQFDEVPPPLLAEAVETVRRELGTRTGQRRQRVQFVHWTPNTFARGA